MSEQEIKPAKRATCGCRDRDDIPHAVNCSQRPATDEEIEAWSAFWNSNAASKLRARLRADREKIVALENTMFDAGIAYAEREYRDGEKIAELEAELFELKGRMRSLEK